MLKTIQSLALCACAIFALTFQTNAQRGAAQQDTQPLKQISQERIQELHNKYVANDNVKGVPAPSGGGDIGGCTDIDACNYNDFATIDDGSCCFDGCYELLFGSEPILLNQKAMGGPGFPAWLLTNNLTGETWSSDELGNNFFTSLCLPFGCYTFEVNSIFTNLDVVLTPTDGGIILPLKSGLGGGPGDVIFDVTFNQSSLNSAQFNFSLGGLACGNPGCTAPNACNYDPSAFLDDGSCFFPGCADPNACNFSPNAGCPAECQYFNSCADCLNSNGDLNVLAEIADNPDMLIAPYVNPTPGTGAFVDASPSQWVIAGINDLSEDGGGGPVLLAAAAGGDLGIVVNYTTVGFTASDEATHTIEWSYTTTDGPEYDYAFYILTPIATGVPELVFLTDEEGDANQFGTLELDLMEGDEVVFGIDPTDTCCGAGILTIESITIPGEPCLDPGETCTGDFDGNNVINASDLLSFLAVYGNSCED